MGQPGVITSKLVVHFGPRGFEAKYIILGEIPTPGVTFKDLKIALSTFKKNIKELISKDFDRSFHF